MKPPAGAAVPVFLCFLSAAVALADPIHEAAGAGKVELLRKLIADGTDVNARAADGGTPLHDAALWGHRDIAELLLSKGADVNAKDGNGMTPLHIAANGDHRKLAEVLIGKGAAVDARALNGWTPLHVAAMWGHENVARALIANGADVNARASRDAVALRVPESAVRCHKDVAALLRKKGADPPAGGMAGLTPLGAAILNGQKDMVELLKNHGARE
ncbi:MAG: uncharacterized protein H6Q84_3699 [Deltaproteobacteria bacterium]|nr:uncharacterized protein [Deltaproteobacteria bacterium]